MPPPPSPPAPQAPPSVRAIEVDVVLEPNARPTPITVFADSPEDAFRILYQVGNGVGGTGARNFYYGSVLEPIRNNYKLQLQRVETEILKRRGTLGTKPSAYELRGLAQWAAKQRANTARLWRIPTPSLLVGLEARDWQKYGVGGRTFENLLKRNAASGRTGTAAYDYILKSAAASNAEVSASVSRGARYLKGGGAILGVAGLGVSAYQIYQAPPEQRGAVAERSAVGFAGGLIGGEIAVGLLTVGAALLVATPPGWIIMAVGLVGGIAGGIIADHVFYPPKEEPISSRLSRGYAIDAHRLSSYQGPLPLGSGAGATSLPLIRQVTIVIQRNDTQTTLTYRGYFLAARSAGLSVDEANAFADRYTSASKNLQWISGDPSPKSSATVRAGDIAATVGKPVIFSLNDAVRGELTKLQLGSSF